MIFKGINNQTVEFRITNYQFPEITDCEYDSNWLLVYLKVKSDCGNWETVDPSLLVRDLKDIIEWFEQLSNDIETDTDSLVFMEPNLEFELTKKYADKKRIRITFDLESRRPNAKDDWLIRFVLCHRFRSHCASDFGSNRANVLGSFCAS